MKKMTFSELEKIANGPVSDDHYQECYDIYKSKANEIVKTREKYMCKEKKFLGMRLNKLGAGFMIGLTALAVYLHDGPGKEFRENTLKNYVFEKNQKNQIENNIYANNKKTSYAFQNLIN